MNNNQCAMCGQWSGKSHRCPTPIDHHARTLDPKQAPVPNVNRDEVAARVAAANAALAQPTTPAVGNPSHECDCGDCEYVATDCCESPRPDCETVTAYDSAGDPDVRVCSQDFGCEPEAREAAIRAEDEYWRKDDAAMRDKFDRQDEQEVLASLEPFPTLQQSLTTGFTNTEHGEAFSEMHKWQPDDFTGRCEEINGAFAHYLYDEGEDPVLIDYASNGDLDAPKDYPHTVCVSEGHVYDFTYRQINPTAPIPVIMTVSQWEQGWRQVSTPRDAETLGFMDSDDFEDGLSDVDADAMTLADNGWGTDEDYGFYGETEDFGGDY